MNTGIDYIFTQNLINFGRGLAAKFVGQPFQQYRLNPTSVTNIIDPVNLISADVRAKVTHARAISQVENEYIHTNLFEFLMDNGVLQVGDILVQNDPVYGQNTQFAVASMRPLKKVMCERVESLCSLYRPQSGRATVPAGFSTGYSGATVANWQPFVLTNGVYTPGAPGATPSVIPCGIQNIGQMKNMRPERLPMDTTTSWWFIYVPLLAGLDRIRENDIIQQPSNPLEQPSKFRVNHHMNLGMGTAGQFLVCERLNP